MNKALYNYIRFSEDEIRWEGKRVSNSLAASQFSRHFSLNRESRQPVRASSSPLKHSTYISVFTITIVSCVNVRYFEK